jgi:hypothetical protein
MTVGPHAKALAFRPARTYVLCDSLMMNFLLMAAVLAGSVTMVVAGIRIVRRPPRLDSNSSTERLGPVSERWLTAHRGER